MTDILILGGTGTTGRRIAHRLCAAQYSVRTAARDNADHRPGSAVTDGVERALGRAARSFEDFVAAAAAAGAWGAVQSSPGIGSPA
ncbi:NAD-dependent epimerase/dehydratase family protein [Nocardia sp. BMG111209]|uniref:NAD-dependent epimerase/dehydratase family protein n=1 Tax=Nocardia sp. BMG111209 TaxID=1160137 RepID=UPI000376EA06|nr:NAD-dependent epimerase/dehydratase family protein [Nocardia sp. BMG111209]